MSTIIRISRPPPTHPEISPEYALEFDISIPKQRQEAHDAIDLIADGD